MSTENLELSCDMTMGFDQFGEPLLNLRFTIPEGGGVNLDQAEHLALHILNTVALARANAAISRKLMLDGMAPEKVVRFLQQVLGT